ncbi:MAG: 2-isopropylmalate synthase [Lentisphaerae bacterium]|nr:2-isopropylmalate synthase [Lentisphaerota bacterium]
MGKLKFNRGYNTFDADSYTVHLEDPTEPNLFRDIFPYGEAPRLGFNHRLVPMRMPSEIWITDTTFRDGQQSMPPYSVKEVVDLYKMMYRLGGRAGVIRQAEFFLYTRKDQEAVEKVQELGYRYPEVTGWIRAHKKDMELAKSMGLKETGILTSCSDYHIFLKLKKTRQQAMDDYLRVVGQALELGITPRCHFEDITRADFYGFVVPFAHALMELARESRQTIKIRACDTLGLGVPYPGVAMPRSVPGLIYGLAYYAGVPSEWMEWHGHNDLHLVTANAVTAWLYGCSAANGTMLGIGERTGNPPLEGLIMSYLQLRGHKRGINTRVITDIARYFEKELHSPIAAHSPLVGRDFNVTRAGIHADGLMKNEEIYNVFDTEKLLKRPVSVAVTDKSGLAGIVMWVHGKIGRGAGEPLTKDHPGVRRIHQWIMDQYKGRRTTAISDQEMVQQVKRHLKDWIKESGFDLSDFDVR